MFVYNIGQRKLIIQNTLPNGKKYVYELPAIEKFMNFVEFMNFEDIGFYPDKLKIECCSTFVFLTLDKTNIIVNVLMIDPYYTIP